MRGLTKWWLFPTPNALFGFVVAMNESKLTWITNLH